MSESHTPGPWVAGKEAPSDPHETEDVVKAGTFYIASVHRMIGMDEHGDQTIPNANLLAAAPDLLEACKYALARFTHGPDAITNPNDAIVDDLRAAIAKAGGAA